MRRYRGRLQIAAIALCTAVVVMANVRMVGAERLGEESRATFERDVKPVLQRYCYGCHGSDEQEADLRLDKLGTDFVRGPDAETWHDVLNKLNLGEMPPEDEPQPSKMQHEKVVDWLTSELKRAVEIRRSTGGRTVLRRLTRYEYNNTMRDLLGLNLDFAKDLPPEPPSPDGFQNNGSSLGMSPLQVEFYLKAARTAMNKAIVTGDKPQVHTHHADKSAPIKRVKGQVTNRLGPGGKFLARLIEYPTEGLVSVKVKAAAVVPEGAGYPRMQVTIGLRSDVLAPEKTLGEADVIATEDSPQTIEFRGRIEEFPLPGHNPKYPGVLITVRNVYGDGKAKPQKKKGKKKEEQIEDPTQPIIVVHSVEFEGPVLESWPPPHHSRILFASENSDDEAVYVREVLNRFMKRAYRRPVTEAEVEVLASYFAKVRPAADSFEETMREVLAMVLISPDFLYLMEPSEEKAGQQPLSDFELASRLSYFLWSSMPDEELSELAANGNLREPDVLEKQVWRMIADTRSLNLVEHFTSQWLDLSGLDRIAVNPEYYPKFDDRLKKDMRDETQKFFAEILYNDLSALTLLDSDFTMLNQRLAKHYGIPGPRRDDFERVELQPEHRRGGLFGQGSFLLINSTGEDSHPIKRAVWLLERLLDDPPPPPPPDVPELNQDEPDFAALPLKEQLEVHRKKEACNSCHRRIDPWGIPFENFDAIGRWRTDVKRVVGKGKGKDKLTPVVSNATLPSGDAVDGLEDLKAYLLEHERQRFASAVVKKLLTYALGRSLELTDHESVAKLTSEFEKNDFRLSDLITAIVQSEPFTHK